MRKKFMEKLDKETERLKQAIVKKYRKGLDYPTDCDGLVTDIMEKTERRISASTLKRLFGFVKRTSNFSKHTYDTLAKYVGFENWEDYVNLGRPKNEPVLTNDLWMNIKNTADKVTAYNMNSIKEACGVDFKKVIPRQFAEQRFEQFANSNKPVLGLVAPGGWGKTVLIAKLIENLQNQAKVKDSKTKYDVIWLVDAAVISNLFTREYGIKSWIYEQMGYEAEKDLLGILHNNPLYRMGRLIIMIDGIDEVGDNEEKLKIFIDNLLRVIASSITLDWLKIVIACRPNTWFKINDAIGDNKSLQNAFYQATFSNRYEDVINVPPLNPYEIEKIGKTFSRKFRYPELEIRQPELIQDIKVPYMLHLYLKKIGNNQDMSQQINLIIQYIKSVILSGPNGANKLELINSVVRETKFGIDSTNILKERLDPLIEKYEDAYNELLSYGLFHEYNELDKYLTYTRYIRFTDQKLFEFFTANLWLRDNKFTPELLDQISEHYGDNPLQFDILKWIVKYAFFENNFDVLNGLYPFIDKHYLHTDDDLDKENANKHLMQIIGVELRQNNEIRKKILPDFAKNELSRKLYFETFIDFDFVVNQFGKSIDIYEKHTNKNDKQSQSFIHSVKFMQNFFNANTKGCKKEFDQLRKIDDVQGFSHQIIGLHFAAQILYQALIQEKFEDNFAEQLLAVEKQIAESSSPTEEVLPFYVSLIEAYNLAKKYDAVRKIMDTFEGSFVSSEELQSNPDYLIMQAIHSNALLHTGERKKAVNEFSNIDIEFFHYNNRYFRSIIYYFIKINFLLHNNEEEEAQQLVSRIGEMSQVLQYKFFEDKIAKIKI